MTIVRIREGLSSYEKKHLEQGNLIPSAVLFPIVQDSDGLKVLLLQRSNQVEHHSGEVSFPGGRIDSADKSPLDAALRESREEVGILRQNVEMLGELDDYLTVTGYHITPFLGLLSDVSDLSPRTIETTDLFFVPLSFFQDPQNIKKQYIEWQGQPRVVYVSVYANKTIWGATLAMIMNFIEVIADENRQIRNF